jgi:hypothetical protein
MPAGPMISAIAAESLRVALEEAGYVVSPAASARALPLTGNLGMLVLAPWPPKFVTALPGTEHQKLALPKDAPALLKWLTWILAMLLISLFLVILAIFALVMSCFTKVCNLAPPKGTEIEDFRPSTRANLRCLPDGGCHVDLDLTISWRRRWAAIAGMLTIMATLCLVAEAFIALWNA